MIKRACGIYLKLLIILLLILTLSCSAGSIPNKNALEYLKTSTEKCLVDESRATPCLEDFFSKYLQHTNVKETLQRLEFLAQSSSDLGTECHVVAHALGRQVLIAQGTIEKAFNECSEECSRGCYHGAVEKFFWREGYSKVGDIHDLNREKLKTKIIEACKSAPSGEIEGECWHGVGHGLMLMLDYNLKPALSLCDSYEQEELRKSCYSGVFMENVLGVGTAKEKKFLKTSDWNFPCNDIEDKYREDCYAYQVIWMEINGLSPEEVIKECQKAGNYTLACIGSLGGNLGDFLDNNAKDMAEVCDSISAAELKRTCMRGAMATLLELKTGADAASKFCSAFKIKEDKDYCSGLANK